MMFRVSLRELLALVAILGLVIVSMRSASTLWQCIIGLAVMISIIAGFSAGLFGRGPCQAFAIGFTVVVCAYLFLLASSDKFDDGHVVKRNAELSIAGTLPTSVILRYMWSKVAYEAYIVDSTGEILTKNDPEYSTIGMNARGTYQTNSGRVVRNEQLPLLENFMSIGHGWWAFFLGYISGRSSRHFYNKRAAREVS